MFGKSKRSTGPLGRDFFEGILEETGFEPSQANVDAVARLFGMMMMASILVPLERANPSLAATTEQNMRWNGKTPLERWPEKELYYLEAMVKTDRNLWQPLGPVFAEKVAGIVQEVRAVMLETATSPGSFFDRPRHETLPIDWRSS